MDSGNMTVSTGQAARLCGVKPDTVLKWIKAKKIDANRTVGGHFRIDRDSLQPFMTGDENTDVSKLNEAGPAIEKLHCWEYCGGEGGRMHKDCLECIVFKSGAENCYVLVALGKKGGHSGVYCKKSCEDCTYYTYVRKIRSKVLVITDNKQFRDRLEELPSDTMEVQFACCGYTASTAVGTLVPDVILVDEKLNKACIEELCTHLMEDSRLTKTRIYLATEELKTGSLSAKTGSLLTNHCKQLKTVEDYWKDKKYTGKPSVKVT